MVITFVKRPVSPLVFEPLETPPEDIICPGSDQEYDYDDDKRAKKKLRVEILGRQYLEGRPLFIQSAGLRGPFEESWVNPWAREKRKRGTNDTKRRLETAADEEESHTLGLEVGKVDSTEKRRRPGNISNGFVNGDSEKPTSVVKRSPVRADHTAKRRKRDSIDESRHDDEVERLVKTGPAAPKNIKNDWLKTDHAYLQAGSRSTRRSPTPTAGTKSRTKLTTLPPPERAQHRRASSRTTPDVQRNDVYGCGFTPINQRSEPEDVEIQPEPVAEPPRQDPKQFEAPTTSSPMIRVGEIDLHAADERTIHAHEEVQRLSQTAVKRAVKEDLQAKKESQEAASRAYHSKLEPYVSEFVVTDHATSSAGLKAASRVPKPSPHAAPPSTNLPEFQYRYTRKCSSSGSSRDGIPVVTGVEPVQKRARSVSSSSSDSEAFAQELEAAQIKAAAAKSFGSSHSSSSPAVEGHETNSIKKNTQALRRLTFTPSGGAKLAKSRTSSRPSSNSPTIGQAKSKTSVREGNGLVRKESTKSSELGISDGTRSRDSFILPEAQVVPNAPVQLAQSRSDPSTNLLETDKRSINLPSFDEGDSYLNLSTQAAFVKAQRSFKDDLYSLKSSPLQEKAGKTSTAASRYTAPDVTPLAKGGRANGTTRQQTTKAEENDDEEALSTQAMVDAMSPFAITTIKKRPPPLQKRTSFAPSPTKEQSPTRIRASASSPTMNPFSRTSLSMSTSTSPSQRSPSPKSPPPPAPSNPHTPCKHPTSSTLTSFSILPNGTLTETSIYQDGQQLPQQHELDWDTSLPLDPFGLTSTAEGPRLSSGNDRTTGNKQPSSLDLNAVLEDAGSFLGEWDVEAEARREGRRERNREKERVEGRRGILVGKGEGS